MTEETTTLAPAAEPPRAVLAFSPDAVAMLLEGLGKLPIERALGLYTSVRDEAAKQLTAPAIPPA